MVETWKTTGPLLEEMRAREARSMTESQRIQATIDVLNVPGNKPVRSGGNGELVSGLVIQQALFSKSWK